MPCGPLQAMQLFALSTGSWYMGALSMFCFSLGTVPLMLGVGLISGTLNRRFAGPMRIACAALVAVMGMSMRKTRCPWPDLPLLPPYSPKARRMASPIFQTAFSLCIPRSIIAVMPQSP